jgi:hypothetical protein
MTSKRPKARKIEEYELKKREDEIAEKEAKKKSKKVSFEPSEKQDEAQKWLAKLATFEVRNLC